MESQERRLQWLTLPIVFCLHTVLVYGCAIKLSPWIASHLFQWIPMRAQSSSAGDWYLQHLEMATVLPALLIGYFQVFRLVPNVNWFANGRRSDLLAIFAWIIPALILAYNMLAYHDPSGSVLYEGSLTSFKYFFEIQRTMPNPYDPFAGDPARLAAQMTITAPFYAGISYSFGAFVRTLISKKTNRPSVN